MNEFQVNGNTYQAKRFALKEWLKFSEVQEKIIDAAERQDVDALSDGLCSFLSAVVGVDVSDAPWYEVAEGYGKYTIANAINDKLPILHSLKKKFQELPAWEYEGRTFYWWAHLLGKSYSWTLFYIANLDIDDALALLQEIMVDVQLEHEWEWMMSEIAYPYNESSKKSEFHPLPRPEWMTIPNMKKEYVMPKVRIPNDMMPKGIVISYNPDETTIN